MKNALLWLAALAALVACSEPAPPAPSAPKGKLAFPGALGWAATTPGGRGGQILKVTTLNADGPGSFLAALNTPGPRIIVFEVGGVIDLGQKEYKITEPFLTVAGQTAPSPGTTFIRGGFGVATHDVVIRHIRVKVGDAGAPKKSGWEADALSISGGHDVIVDHCTLTWATDENGSISGPRFKGRRRMSGVKTPRATSPTATTSSPRASVTRLT